MRKFAFTMALGLSLCGVSAFAEEWTGYISDAKCAKAHTDGSEKAMKCVAACVKGGVAPVFIVDDKIIKIDKDSQSKVMEHLGHKVTVTGDLKDDTVTIASVKMAE